MVLTFEAVNEILKCDIREFKAATTAAATNQNADSINSITSRELNYGAVIPTQTSRMCVNYLGTLLIGTAFKFRQRIKKSPSCVHVLHKT